MLIEHTMASLPMEPAPKGVRPVLPPLAFNLSSPIATGPDRTRLLTERCTPFVLWYINTDASGSKFPLGYLTHCSY